MSKTGFLVPLLLAFVLGVPAGVSMEADQGVQTGAHSVGFPFGGPLEVGSGTGWVAALGDQERAGLEKAVREHRVGAQIAVFAQGRNIDHESWLGTDGRVEVEGDRREHRLEVTVFSHAMRGPIVIVDIHEAVMDPQRGLDVHYRDVSGSSGSATPVDMEPAEGLSSLLSCRSAQPEYWALVHDEGRTLFVCPPSGAEQSFVVTGRDEPVHFPLVAPLGLGLLAGLVATVRLRKWLS